MAVTSGIVDELDELIEEYAEFGASRSELLETILTTYSQSHIDHVIRV